MPVNLTNKDIITTGTFVFSLVASGTILGIASYKILSNDSNNEIWTGLLTFLVGLYIPSPLSTYTKYTTTGNAVVQQNIQHPEQIEV